MDLGHNYPKRGTGCIFAMEFIPPSPNITPGELFPASVNQQPRSSGVRFIRRDDPSQILIYADGACLNNGQANPKAGWAFVFRLVPEEHDCSVADRLERRGPFGDEHAQTSNRAELRAVISALRFRHWPGEGFTTIVLATDSEYVAVGATQWIYGWLQNGWRTRSGKAVKNKDLWEALLGEIDKCHSHGATVKFWRIPRAWNTLADAAAKRAADCDEIQDKFTDLLGLGNQILRV